MRFEQVRGLLEHTRALHRGLAEHYERLGGEVERERMRMLLEYMAHLEHTIEHALQHYEEDGPRLVLDTWLDCAAGEPFAASIEHLGTASDVSVERVVAEVLDVHARVVSAYEGIASGSVPPEVSDLLEDVVRMEKTQGKRLAHAAGLIDDF